MQKKTYEVIEESKVVNMNNETVGTLKVGDTVTGELVLIADKDSGEETPYVEIEEGRVVLAKGLAEKLSTASVDPQEKIATQIKGSNKKIIYSLVGAGIGYGVAHYMKKDMKMKVVFTVAGLALGLGAEYMISRKSK
jgi:hypothetical protein